MKSVSRRAFSTLWHYCTALIVIAMLSGLVAPVLAEEGEDESPDPWGVAMGYRSARIPYPAEEQRVSDVFPLFYYENKYVFLRGLTGGIKLFQKDKWQFSAIGRYRFFDIPAEFQNEIRESGLDLGLQTRYRIRDDLETNLELMSDLDGRILSNLTSRYSWESGRWDLFPYATLRFKSSSFNEHYFGLDGFDDPDNPGSPIDNKIGSGWDLTLGSEVRFHVISDLYLLGRINATALLDQSTRDSASIDNDIFGEGFLGFGFFEDKNRKASRLEAKPYWRVAYGWATPSTVGDIFYRFNYKKDPQNNRMASVFYGHPLADSLFTVKAFDIYLTPGFVYHLPADPYTDPDSGIVYDSQPTTEFVLAVKFYLNIRWPVDWRIGFAEGISYASDVPNLEQRSLDRKGFRASNLLNYLDFTFDVSLGDLFRSDRLHGLWLGYSVHHRSGIFETASAFGRISGGSNFNTFYLQYHF